MDNLKLIAPAIIESIENWLEVKVATSTLASNTRVAYHNDVTDFFIYLGAFLPCDFLGFPFSRVSDLVA